MSNVEGTETPGEQYTSAIDPAFSTAWNAIYNPEDGETDSASGTETDPAAGGDQTPVAPVEGAGTESPATGTPAEGAGTSTGTAAGTDAGTTAADDAAGVAAKDTAGIQPDPTGVLGGNSPVSTVAYADVIPRIAESAKAIEESAARSFKAQATKELHDSLGPKYLAALAKHPRLMIGDKVPDLKGGDGEIQLRDSADAKEWQEAATSLIEAEIADRVKIKTQEVAPVMSTLQESMLLFQNNSDLMPGTKEFDKELADEFADLAEEFEFRIDGKLFGYHADVQPLINKLRVRLATQRGASGVHQTQARQAQAAAQTRDEAGKFDAPQAGITSKAGTAGEPEDDYADFFTGVGMKGMTV